MSTSDTAYVDSQIHELDVTPLLFQDVRELGRPDDDRVSLIALGTSPPNFL